MCGGACKSSTDVQDKRSKTFVGPPLMSQRATSDSHPNRRDSGALSAGLDVKVCTANKLAPGDKRPVQPCV